MSAYDTTYRDRGMWVRYYCELPTSEADDDFAIYLDTGTASRYMGPQEAADLAHGLLQAASKYLKNKGFPGERNL